MFARSQGPIPGLDLAFPDVCLTPVVVPVPVPYPNIAMSVTSIPTVFNHFIMGMPAHNLMTVTVPTLGDFGGVLGGVMSGMFAGPARHLMGSTNVFHGPAPATKMLDVTAQNGFLPNAVGTALSPSQVKVLIMR